MEDLSISILRGHIDGKRAQGRQRIRWTDDVKDWTKKTIVEGKTDTCGKNWARFSKNLRKNFGKT